MSVRVSRARVMANVVQPPRRFVVFAALVASPSTVEDDHVIELEPLGPVCACEQQPALLPAKVSAPLPQPSFEIRQRDRLAGYHEVDATGSPELIRIVRRGRMPSVQRLRVSSAGANGASSFASASRPSGATANRSAS